MYIRFLVWAVILGSVVSPTQAYTLSGYQWSRATVAMHLQLGAAAATLADGSASWGASAEDALATWNTNIGNTRFLVERDSTAARAQGNRTNNVFFSQDVYGSAWGTGVLAVTLTFTSANATVETDVLFNNRLTWDSYRGPMRSAGNGTPLYDFHRVAMHEFGHALGLEHPDEKGQTVSALMNSRITSVDTLTSDDIAGAQALYGPPSSVVATQPTITTQPLGRSVTVGESVTFTVAASGTGPLNYQWLKNGAAFSGANTFSLTIAGTVTADSGHYTVIVSNTAGSVISAPATLTVNSAPPPTPNPAPPPTPNPTPPPTPNPTPPPTPSVLGPTISLQPFSVSVESGSVATFSVSAAGTSPIVYQWRKDGVAISGATAAVYRIAQAQSGDAGNYTVLVSNPGGSIVSSSVTLTVRPLPAVLPTISSQPSDTVIEEGQSATFAVSAGGTAPLTYQWRKDGTAVAGANASTYRITPAQLSDAGSYVVVVSNAAGSATSAAATLSVRPPPSHPPAITTPPLAQNVASGERVTMRVAASSSDSLTFQWLKNGLEVAGATAPTLIFDPIRPADLGNYAVRVTNSAGSVTTPAVALTVRYSRLVNLSTRGHIPMGGSLTPGFFLRGAGMKSVLVRGVGPTLTLFGIGSAVGSAHLEVIAQNSGAIIASNENWGGKRDLNEAFAQVGAFPLAADSKDAAVEVPLAASGYTVRVSPGDATMSGVSLAEIYDTEALTSPMQLVNASTLGMAGTGDNVLSAGFVISGNAPKRLLIRAVGPGLTPFGVGERLVDPQLGLFPLGRNEPIASNDNWPDLPSLRSAFAASGAFELSPGSKDAALVISLEPGAYTAVVSGVNESVGNVLVELYDLDP